MPREEPSRRSLCLMLARPEADVAQDCLHLTANLDQDAHQYFQDLGKYLDAGYYQNAFFEWNGSGNQVGHGRSTSSDRFTNRPIEFVAEQGLAVLRWIILARGL